MESSFKISIPKPCHESWRNMTPDEQGRFCSVCAKSVVDFTNMDSQEMQQFVIQNQGRKICGRFRQEQVEPNFKISISESFLYQNRSFRKAFLLALFVVMGTTLFSCKNEKGQALQEINVESETQTTMGAPVFTGKFQEATTQPKKKNQVATVETISVSEISLISEPQGDIMPPEPPLMGTPVVIPVEFVSDSLTIVKDTLKNKE
ncbi:hypothetical protein [Flavobacterium sp.]|uniref:hypothetical protein n=1 Tax=Flavobacterium sp. TaxID=239 RepID=UPI003D141B3A